MDDLSESTSSTALRGLSGSEKTGYSREPAPSAPGPKCGWKFEEAEMPSYDHIDAAPKDGKYHCQHPKCQDRVAFLQKALFR